MKAMNHLSAIPRAEASPRLREEDTRVVLLITADAALCNQLIGALTGNGNFSRQAESRPYQVPIATTVAQARMCFGRVTPSVIVLDESAATSQFTDVLKDLARIAPVVFLAAAENIARSCTLGELTFLITQGRVECVLRQGDFVPLAMRLIERHAGARPGSSGFGTVRHAGPSLLVAAAERLPSDSEDLPLDFGEVLRHEVNNPLTGILGNAELLLSRRDRISADMVERLEIIAELAIRLRETVRRLSNTLESRAARIPARTSHEPSSFHRHLPPT